MEKLAAGIAPQGRITAGQWTYIATGTWAFRKIVLAILSKREVERENMHGQPSQTGSPVSSKEPPCRLGVFSAQMTPKTPHAPSAVSSLHLYSSHAIDVGDSDQRVAFEAFGIGRQGDIENIDARWAIQTLNRARESRISIEKRSFLEGMAPFCKKSAYKSLHVD